MVDAAKYADLVLLLVDGAFGFEMETFEFLNILQARAPGRSSSAARAALCRSWISAQRVSGRRGACKAPPDCNAPGCP